MRFGDNSDFYCCKCGKKGMPVLRRRGAEREAGHLKKLFCIYCKQEWNHAECKPYTHYDYNCFLLEYNYHNFDNEGNRIMPYGLFKDKLVKEGVI